MSVKTMTAITVGAFMLVAAAPATAQERGTIEFGAFANYSDYDDDLRIVDGWGGGVRFGAFLFPRLMFEVEAGRKDADRPDGLQNVEVEVFAWRLTGVPVVLGPLQLLLGAGAIHTDWQNNVTDGYQTMFGLKFGLGSMAALRAQYQIDWNHNDKRNKAWQFGLSIYRHPGGSAAAAPTVTMRVDTVRTVRVDTVRAAATVAALPTGQAATICLATGEDVQVLVTAQNDTLVGPSRTSVRVLRQGGVAFAGEYAQGRAWFDEDQPIMFELRSFRKSDGEIRLNCPDLRRVGDFQGVPLFVQRAATAPYQQLYMPVRPGVWQTYENFRGMRG